MNVPRYSCCSIGFGHGRHILPVGDELRGQGLVRSFEKGFRFAGEEGIKRNTFTLFRQNPLEFPDLGFDIPVGGDGLAHNLVQRPREHPLGGDQQIGGFGG